MRELFDVSELVRVGVEDETSGVAFYSQLAQQASSPQMRQVFSELAQEEKYHKRRFEQMLESLGGTIQRQQYPGEYMEYLKVLTAGRAFPDEASAVEAAKACKDDRAALELASRFERDTIVLMDEMQALLPDKDRDIVRELVREEQSHLVRLAKAKQLLTA